MKSECEIVVEGRLDATRSVLLEGELSSAIQKGLHEVCVNLSRVVFVSSAGLRVLIKYAQQFKRMGGLLCVTEPSETVRTTLALSGLMDTLMPLPTPGFMKNVPIPECTAQTPVSCSFVREKPGASMALRLVGNPAQRGRAPQSPGEVKGLKLPRGMLAAGRGAFGAGFEDCQARLGDFLAAGGCAATQPSDETQAADYMVTQGALIPEVQAYYAFVGEGDFAWQARFETPFGSSGVSLPTLAQAALKAVSAPSFAWVVAAELEGWGHELLKRLPAVPTQENRNSLALLVGLVTSQNDQRLADFVRPMAGDPTLRASHHAAIFPHRPLPKGRLNFEDVMEDVLGGGVLSGVVHLTEDERSGAGLFSRGVFWASPIASVSVPG